MASGDCGLPSWFSFMSGQLKEIERDFNHDQLKAFQDEIYSFGYNLGQFCLEIKEHNKCLSNQE